MSAVEVIFTLAIAGIGMALANFVGFGVGFGDSLPGVLVLLVLAAMGAGLKSIIPLRLPTVAYCSILGLLAACPLSPIRDFVIAAAGKINFTAPLTIVGAFAGMSISNQLKTFIKTGWRYVIVAILVMTGTFLASALIGQIVMTAMGQI
ncbi:MAG: hypothetical protein IJU30_05450 [Lachnospiraceae bacterium]|nr:hypothetical protein [Lachnospiraceae bacterium]